MTKRLLFPSLFVATLSLTSLGCQPAGDDGPTDSSDRSPVLDSWREEISGPASQISKLVIGGRLASNNFANRGDIEVRYVANTDQITIEMRRFTIAKTQQDAELAFGRMKFWAYNIATPKAPTPADDDKACFADGQATCYVRNYYDGQLQPVRDGAHFRVTIPAGWDGDLELKTQDNLGAGIDTYPDRSEVLVDGVAGDLLVELDSGNVQIRMDPNTKHYARCAANDACVADGFPLGCGCSEPTNITVSNRSGQASDITVDVSNPDAWYDMQLQNRGSFSSSSDFVCTATIDCEPFAVCNIAEDFADIPFEERAEINYPGEPAISGAGIRITLVSESCANITLANSVDDYELDTYPEEKRGDLKVCVGCIEVGSL
jgi:hypothetical protein